MIIQGYSNKRGEWEELDPVGMTISRILIDGIDANDTKDIGSNLSAEEVTFHLTDGDKTYHLTMYHEQDCCETVELVDAAGSWQEMVGKTVAKFDEIRNPPHAPDVPGWAESWTWTFYDVATTPTGYVTMRWLGLSNGYYSESVHFRLEEQS